MKRGDNAILFLYNVARPIGFLLLVGMIVAGATGIAAAAGGQIQSRSIMMSDSAASGGTITTGVGSGTNVTYRATFTAASSYTLKGIVLDFCSGTGGTPFIGDSTCSAPTNFTVGASPSLDGSNYTVGASTTTGIGATGWTATSINSGQTLELSNSTGVAVTSGTAYTFAISGITNPSDLGIFYGRLMTYTSTVGTYTHGSPGSYQDYGGFALSTANTVQVTAKVQETITFCVLGGVPNPSPPPDHTAPTSCTDAGATAPAILLGHGTNDTLDGTAVDTNQVYTFISTNALHGVNVRMHNSNSCGGLSVDHGSTCGIPATNGGAATTPTSSAGAMQPGTAAFGVAVATGGGTTVSQPYDGDPASNYYGLDTTTSGANTTTTFGSTVLTSPGPLNNVMNTWQFAATANNTTAAGIYTATLAVIATGTF